MPQARQVYTCVFPYHHLFLTCAYLMLIVLQRCKHFLQSSQMYALLQADMRCNGTSTAMLSGSLLLFNFKEFLAWFMMCMAIALAINCVNPVCFNPFLQEIGCLSFHKPQAMLSYCRVPKSNVAVYFKGFNQY